MLLRPEPYQIILLEDVALSILPYLTAPCSAVKLPLPSCMSVFANPGVNLLSCIFFPSGVVESLFASAITYTLTAIFETA